MKLLARAMTLVIVGVITLLFNSCAEEATVKEMKEVEGCWIAKLSDHSGEQAFVFLLKVKEGRPTGEVHSYMNGIKLEGMELGEIEYYPPEISIAANQGANVRYRADVDVTAGIMNGELVYSDGTSKEMILHRYNDAMLKKEFPGIAELLGKKDFEYSKPVQYEDGIETASMNSRQINSSLINKMVRNIYTGDFGVVNAVLITLNNKLVFEKYLGGYTVNDLQGVRSVTKSIGSLCVGIAIDQVKIKSVDEKVIDFFPEYSSDCPAGWDKITIKHLLTMSMGLDWGDGLDEHILFTSNNFLKDVLMRPIKFAPGEKWEYINPNVTLIAGIIKHASGMHIDEFADKFLFIPLGIKKYNWNQSKQNGYPRVDGTLALRPRDMLKIGMMMLNEGKYNGEHIISKKWIDESMKYQIGIDDIFSYGYLWWRAVSQADPGTEIAFANGLGGHHIIIVPKYNLVVVTSGGNYEQSKMKLIMKMVDDYIIKSVIK